MGKGDRRTKRGKLSAGTYGNSRKRKRKLNKKNPRKAAPKGKGAKR